MLTVDDEEQVLLELTYPEITNIVTVKAELPSPSMGGVKVHANHFSLKTIRGDFSFRSTNAEDIQELIAFFLDGLKRKSKYCVAIQDYKVQSSLKFHQAPSMLHFYSRQRGLCFSSLGAE